MNILCLNIAYENIREGQCFSKGNYKNNYFLLKRTSK